MASPTDIRPIEIPSATDDPDAYVDALLATAAGFDAFDVLPRTPVRAGDLCADLPASLAAQPPEPGEWAPELIIGHLFDVDMVYGFRWRLMLTQDDPSYPGYDEARWAPLPRLPLWQMIDAWAGLRAMNVALLRSLDGAAWERPGRHGEQGPETVERTVRKVVGHDIAHLNQLYRAVRTARASAGLDIARLDAAYAAFGR